MAFPAALDGLGDYLHELVRSGAASIDVRAIAKRFGVDRNTAIAALVRYQSQTNEIQAKATVDCPDCQRALSVAGSSFAEIEASLARLRSLRCPECRQATCSPENTQVSLHFFFRPDGVRAAQESTVKPHAQPASGPPTAEPTKLSIAEFREITTVCREMGAPMATEAASKSPSKFNWTVVGSIIAAIIAGASAIVVALINNRPKVTTGAPTVPSVTNPK
jgi:hypothetical protein